MICRFPILPRICWRFYLLLLYSNIRLIVLCQFDICSCWMFSYGSHIWVWMLCRKRHNNLLFLDFLRLLWYSLGIVHYWLNIFRWLGIGIFLYFLSYFLMHVLAILSFWGLIIFFVMRINCFSSWACSCSLLQRWPEITPYLDTFHAVQLTLDVSNKNKSRE